MLEIWSSARGIHPKKLTRYGKKGELCLESKQISFIIEQRGLALVYVAIVILVMASFGALSYVYSYALFSQRDYQKAADAGSFSAVMLLEGNLRVPIADVKAEVESLVQVNFVDALEIQEVQCRFWDKTADTFSPLCSSNNSCDCPTLEANSGSITNAVRVVMSSNTVSSFGGLLGNTNALSQTIQSISWRERVLLYCIKPMAIPADAVELLGSDGSRIPWDYQADLADNNDIDDLTGDFIVNFRSGNWAKLDLDTVNASSGKVWTEAMRTERYCDAGLEAGSTLPLEDDRDVPVDDDNPEPVCSNSSTTGGGGDPTASTGTGFSGISKIFSDLLKTTNPGETPRKFVFPLVDSYSCVSGNTDVRVVGFVEAEFVTCLRAGKNGQSKPNPQCSGGSNLELQFQVINVDPAGEEVKQIEERPRKIVY